MKHLSHYFPDEYFYYFNINKQKGIYNTDSKWTEHRNTPSEWSNVSLSHANVTHNSFCGRVCDMTFIL